MGCSIYYNILDYACCQQGSTATLRARQHHPRRRFYASRYSLPTILETPSCWQVLKHQHIYPHPCLSPQARRPPPLLLSRISPGQRRKLNGTEFFSSFFPFAWLSTGSQDNYWCRRGFGCASIDCIDRLYFRCCGYRMWATNNRQLENIVD